MVRVRAIMATTDLIPSYGGFQLSLEQLQEMQTAVKAGALETRFHHDSRRPLRVGNVDTGIDQRTDGEYKLWVEFDTDDEPWAEFEAERKALGAPGGFSFTLIDTFAETQGSDELAPVSFVVAADAGHFTDEQILAAVGALAEVGPAKASRLYQFAVESTALALIQFILQEGAQVPANVFASWLYDALRRLRPHGGTPAVDLEVIEDGAGRRTIARIPAQTDPEVAKRAIEAWESVASRTGTYEWTQDEEWRIIRHGERE